MHTSVEQTVKQHQKAAKTLREKMKRDPEYAKSFLLKAGILTKSKSAPHGVILAKRFRSAS